FDIAHNQRLTSQSLIELERPDAFSVGGRSRLLLDNSRAGAIKPQCGSGGFRKDHLDRPDAASLDFDQRLKERMEILGINPGDRDRLCRDARWLASDLELARVTCVL